MRILFFFSSRRRHTRYWRDWSSDVCSSDLRRGTDRNGLLPRPAGLRRGEPGAAEAARAAEHRLLHARPARARGPADRESGVEGKRVDLGGRRIIKKKKTQLIYCLQC